LTRRAGSTVRDINVIPVDASAPARVLEGAGRAGIDGMQPVYDAQGTRMAFVRNGDVFVRDLRSGALAQLTRTDAMEASLQWSHDGALVWRAGNDWYRWTAQDGVTQAASLRAEDDPAKPPKSDLLRERQLELFETLRRERDQREAARKQEEQWRREDGSRAPAPIHMGKDVEIAASALSPDGRWLFVATEKKSEDRGQRGRMPKDR